MDRSGSIQLRNCDTSILLATFVMQRQRFLLIGLGLLTLWRLALLPVQELSPDEALIATRVHLGQWLGFEGCGPLLVCIVRLTTWIGGAGEMGVRMIAPFAALWTSLLLWQVSRRLYDAAVASWSVVILNMVPAFNLIAVTLTPATVLNPFILFGLLRMLGTRDAAAGRVDRWIASACLAAAVLVQPALIFGIVLVTLAWLGTPWSGYRQVLKSDWRKIGGVLLPMLVMVLVWVVWETRHGWPSGIDGGWTPCLYIAPNFLRWVVMVSPLLLTFLVLAALKSKDGGRGSFVLLFLLPMAAVDFFWGAWNRWPDGGAGLWVMFAAILLGYEAVTNAAVRTEDRISLRTIAIVLAAVQSAFTLFSDQPRSLGLPWKFARQTTQGSIYVRFFSADPAAVMRGWRQTAALVGDILKKSETPGQPPWFVIAEDWRLAAPLSHYLPADAPCFTASAGHPRVQARQDEHSWDEPYSWWPRYDGLENGACPYMAHPALYVTADPSNQPPPSIRRAFARTEVISIARIMHGGQEVRTIKIFACYDYRPPEF